MRRQKICIDSLLHGDVKCVNPKFHWESHSDCLSISCVTSKCIEVEITEGCKDLCFTLYIHCEDSCFGPKTFKQVICLCENNDDCDDCEICTDGICVNKCPDQHCSNGDCVDCVDDVDCPCNQVCLMGECACPTGMFLNDKGCCVDCITNGDCEECEICVGGDCVPRVCPNGVCLDDTCVECITSDQCGLNECCVDNTCQCCPGYVWNPTTQTCDPDECECASDNECGTCSLCINCICQPQPCPDGTRCIDDKCVPVCDCIERDCPGRSICIDFDESTCICQDCKGGCDSNNPCPYGCLCINGECEPNPCVGKCDSADDCGEGCGCYNGECYPCDKLSCLTDECAITLGCVCYGTACVSTDCVGFCSTPSDCGEGCGCYDNQCTPCPSLSCDGPCEEALGCNCINNLCNSDECYPDSADLRWELIPGVPGTQTNPGLEKLTGSTQVSNHGLVTGNAGLSTGIGFYYAHNFNASVHNSSGEGQWYFSPSMNVEVPIQGQTNPSVQLRQDLGPVFGNILGFLLIFKDNDGRVARFTFNRKPNTTLQEGDSWVGSFTYGSGKNPTFEGGTSSYWVLKIFSSEFTFQNIDLRNIQRQGPPDRVIDINFTYIDPYTLRASITGCGIWSAEVLTFCNETPYYLQVPEFVIEETKCCPPTDPDCVRPPNPPCTEDEIEFIPMIYLPYYDGAGGGVVFPDLSNISFNQLWRLTGYCWSTEECEGTNDIVTGINVFGNNTAATYLNVQYNEGGLAALGFQCELYLGNCQYIKGELCLESCEVFDIYLTSEPGNKFKVVPSLAYPNMNFNWTVNDPTGIINIETHPSNLFSIITIDPFKVTSVSVEVEAITGEGICKEGDDIDVDPPDVYGCTIPSACNYNPQATIDDSTCQYAGCPDPNATNFQPNSTGCECYDFNNKSCCEYPDPCIDPVITNVPFLFSYSCENGASLTPANGYTFKINGVNVQNGSFIPAGQHQVLITDIHGCTRTIPFNIPQCYTCNSSFNCVESHPNSGLTHWECVENCTEILGCMDPESCTYDPEATVNDPNLCKYAGCNDPTAIWHTLDAYGCNCIQNNKSCCSYVGCTIQSACNYNPQAIISNNSVCIFEGCPTNPNNDPNRTYGCNCNPQDSSCCPQGVCEDENACNTGEGVECIYPGCPDPMYENYVEGAIGCNCVEFETNCCSNEPPICGCPDPMYDNYVEGAIGCGCVPFETNCCANAEVCSDPAACNTGQAGDCIYPGCPNPIFNNYVPNAIGCNCVPFETNCCTNDTVCEEEAACNTGQLGDCVYPGCPNPNFDNYVPNAVGCNCVPFETNCCQNDPDPICGCPDPTAMNYTLNAVGCGCVDAETNCCEYPCLDPAACNYEGVGPCWYDGCPSPNSPNYAVGQGGCNCVYGDTSCCEGCIPENVVLEWQFVPGTPGTGQGNGVPALVVDNISIQDLGLVNVVPYGLLRAQEFIIALGAGQGPYGNWYYSPDINTNILVGTGVSSINLDHSNAPLNFNMYGFLIKYIHPDGRQLHVKFIRDTSLPLTAPNAWSHEIVYNSSIPETFVGGTLNQWKLCVTSGNFEFEGPLVSNITITNEGFTPIEITFTQESPTCLVANISGCGTWQAQVPMLCGEEEILVDIPPFTVDPLLCCDPLDPECDAGPGTPCSEYTLTNVNIIIHPVYSEGNPNSYLAFIDINSLTFEQLYAIGSLCWETTDNNGVNDIVLYDGPFNNQNLYVQFTFEQGGCIKVGGEPCTNTYVSPIVPTGTPQVYMDHHTVECKQVVVYAKARRFGNVGGVQFPIHWDANKMIYAGHEWILPNQVIAGIGSGNASLGILTVSMSGPGLSDIANHDPFLAITFNITDTNTFNIPLVLTGAIPVEFSNPSGILNGGTVNGSVNYIGSECLLVLPGCELIEGIHCIDLCEELTKPFLSYDADNNSVTAISAINHPNLEFLWDTNLGSSGIVSINTLNAVSTVVVAPGVHTVTVTITIGEEECEAIDTIVIDEDCANDPINTENFEIYYTCQQQLVISPTENYTFEIDSVVVTHGTLLMPGTYTIIITNNITGCQDFRDISVPQCYACVNDECVVSIDNSGSTEAQCNASCPDCIEIVPEDIAACN